MLGRMPSARNALIIFAFVSMLAVNIGQTHAQNDNECDPTAVNEWLMQRQAWRNATSETWQKIVDAKLPWATMPSWLNEFHIHMQAIADLEGPDCTTEVLLWTYYYYDTVGRFFVCGSLGDEDCQADMEERAEIYDRDGYAAIERLQERAGLEIKDYYESYPDIRPEGWSWPPETLREHFPVAYTDGMLDFEGTGDVVSDPVTIPEGIYRVSLETESTHLKLEMVILAGECYVGNSPWETTVFSFKAGGAQSLITSEECDVLWQVENADEPFQISFEKIR